MTRGGMISALACSLIGAAMWWGIIALGCQVARGEWIKVPVPMGDIDPGMVVYPEPESLEVWDGVDSTHIKYAPRPLIWGDTLITRWIQPVPDRVVNLDSLLTEIRQGHNAEVEYLRLMAQP